MQGRFVPGFWQAPLAPVAAAATAGILIDRCVGVPVLLSLAAAVLCLAAWAGAAGRRVVFLPPLYLWATTAALAAAYHHGHRDVAAEDDIGLYAPEEPRPVLLRGVLAEEPIVTVAPAPKAQPPGPKNARPPDPPDVALELQDADLRTFPQSSASRLLLRVTRLKQRDNWIDVSGLVQLSAAGVVNDLHLGDEVEVVGRMVAPASPANPGARDYAAALRDQQVRAVVQVRQSPEGITFLGREPIPSLSTSLAFVRAWAHRKLTELLSGKTQKLALALLLGEDYAMDQTGWDSYQRTAVIHALAISGQHLVVLAGFAWFFLRLCRFRRRSGACLVALLLLTYSLLVGGRPPVMRAAVMVCAVGVGTLLRRPIFPANLFALSWLVVCFLNPTDIFTAGCQLSFLAVAVLVWGLPRPSATEPDPLDRLIEESRPRWQNGLLWFGRWVAVAYGVNAAVWLAVTPLVVMRYNMVSPAGLLIGPPVAILTAIALLAGFFALLTADLCTPLAELAALVIRLSLGGCDGLVSWAENLPGAYWYLADVPRWWGWIFYVTLLAGMTVPWLRERWRQLGLAALGWVCLGLLAGAVRFAPDELRCTFLAVGHGGCAVLETPDGRTLLYDAGAISGPDVTRRQIAPYLWARGIRRIDEVFISHADLDHFNGIASLLERFAVGQVTCTPSFAQRGSPGVEFTLKALERYNVPRRVVHVGDRLDAGGVLIDVLHPPPVGPQGNENSRGMVLLVRHRGHSILLTGDLEGAGLERVLGLPPLPVDVLMAPHHGSKAANIPQLATWAHPAVAVSCQGPPRRPGWPPEPYSAVGARFLTTWDHGAITIRSSAAGLTVQTYRTRQNWSIRGPAE